MKKSASIKTLGLIFGLTLAAEIITWMLGVPPEKSIVRLIFLSGLFVWLLKGSRLARYTLSVVYFLSSLLAAFSAARSGETFAFSVLFWCFSLFSVAAAVFFLRSNVLQALTSPLQAAD